MTHRQYFKKINPLVQYPPATYCPANGMLDPTDPAFPTNIVTNYPEVLTVACPMVGYELTPTGVFVSPITIPTPEAEEIQLLISNEAPYSLYFSITLSAGNARFEIFDEFGASVNVYNGIYWLYTFAAAQPLKFYTVKITPINVGAKILTFKKENYTGNNDWNVYYAKFNTPNLTSMSQAFLGIIALKGCEFNCTLNELTNFGYTFQNTSVGTFTFPASLPKCTYTTSMFKGDKELISVDMNNCQMPLCNSMDSMFMDCFKLLTVNFTCYIPLVTTLNQWFRNSRLLRNLTINWGIVYPVLSSTNCFDYAFYGCDSLVEIDIAACNPNSLNYTFQYCNNLRKITLRGNWTSFTVGYSPIQYSNVEEFIFPNSIKANASFTLIGGYKLKKITMPSSFIAPFTTFSGGFFGAGNLTSLLAFVGSASVVYTRGSLTIFPQMLFDNCIGLKRFDQPLMQTQYLRIKCIALEYVEINWADSFFGATTGQNLVDLRSCNLGVTEINRIFGKLPDLTGSGFTYQIRVSANPGYATCTQSIATNKGWTVA